jgi:predicted RNA polymerase sigma factor
VRANARVEDLLRELAPQVLGGLVRRYQEFAVCEDAVQDALVAAAKHWTKDGVPSNPRSWLVTAASRAVVDEWRSVRARRRREETVAALEPPDQAPPSGQDDSLALLLMCCHPALSVPSQLALTLRAVGGLTTAEIARALLVPEAAMAKRISAPSSSSAAPAPGSSCRRRGSGRAASRSSCTCST